MEKLTNDEKNSKTVQSLEKFNVKTMSLSQNKEFIAAKKKIKDSVFTHLFAIPEYTLQLYKTLHPEDTIATENDITIMTLENIFLNYMYNDLSFLVKDKLTIFVEAQSTWTMNILPRMLLYAATSISRYIEKSSQNVYTTTPLNIPKLEFYVLYVGQNEERPETLSLAKDFFKDENSKIDLEVKMLYGEGKADIITQYVNFAKIYKEQEDIHGRTIKAIQEAIKICKDNDILKKYLEEYEMEVKSIMENFFNYDIILDGYIREERNKAFMDGEAKGESRGEARGKAKGEAIGEAIGKSNALKTLMNNMNISIEQAMQLLSISKEDYAKCEAVLAQN